MKNGTNDKSIWKEELREINQEIAHRIRDIIKETGFTYERFAKEICDIDRVSLANMLAGRHRIDTRVLKNIVNNMPLHPDISANNRSLLARLSYGFLIEGSEPNNNSEVEFEKLKADYQNLKDKFIALTLASV